MKTISLSALILITVPFHVLAQDNEANSYFVQTPVQFEQTVNHITQSQTQSTRKATTPQLNLLVVVGSTGVAEVAPTIQWGTKLQPIQQFEFETPKVSSTDYLNSGDELISGVTSDTLPTIQQATKLQDYFGGDFKPRSAVRIPIPNNNIRVASNQNARFQQFQIRQPEVSPEAFPGAHDVVKPSPQNTFQAPARNQQVIESVPPSPVSNREHRGFFAGESESASLDHLRMSQQSESWEEKPNTMRNIGDHFSPGGEPFAFRGVVGEPNFFGVDRLACCDEWCGFCNCGGLKANPGHLGLPWLRSKENCDAAKKICGKHCGRNAGNSCGCPDCSN